MDERCTLPVNTEFTEIIKLLIADGKHADFLIDVNGLERAAGTIVKLNENTTPAFIELDNGLLIDVGSIIAINGLFTSDYTCC
mgnify:CR=1 FL=1